MWIVIYPWTAGRQNKIVSYHLVFNQQFCFRVFWGVFHIQYQNWSNTCGPKKSGNIFHILKSLHSKYHLIIIIVSKEFDSEGLTAGEPLLKQLHSDLKIIWKCTWITRFSASRLVVWSLGFSKTSKLIFLGSWGRGVQKKFEIDFFPKRNRESNSIVVVIFVFQIRIFLSMWSHSYQRFFPGHGATWKTQSIQYRGKSQ